MINLSNWLDSRGTFKDIEFGSVQLQIVSLSDDLIVGLSALTTHELMVDFVAEHGLSHNRMRISDNDNMCEDLPIIWALPEFLESKVDIVKAIAELNGAEKVLSDKEDEEEELAALEKAESDEVKENVINGDAAIPDVTLGDLHSDNMAAGHQQ